jgi:hypothetical protein
VNRRVSLAIAVAVLVLLDVVLLARVLDSSSPPELVQGSAESSVTPSEQAPGPQDDDQPTPMPSRDIELSVTTSTARPGEAVAIRGRVAEGFPGNRLVVQRRLDGDWTDFPLTTVVLASGRFETYIQLTEPGRYLVRVADPITRAKSNTVPLRVAAEPEGS